MADLVKQIRVPLEIDFMAVSSYGQSTKSSGVVKIIKDLDVPVEGRDILIVEDIIDSGLTLSYLIDVLERRNAKTISVVALFNKPARRTVELEPDYQVMCFQMSSLSDMVWIMQRNIATFHLSAY